MSARVMSGGKVVQLDGRAQPDELVYEQDVVDPTKLSRLLVRILRELASIRRLFSVRRNVLEFEDVVVDATGATLYRLPHKFGGKARYTVVSWAGAAAFNLREDASSTTAVLVLTSTSAGTATIRVEEAG